MSDREALVAKGGPRHATQDSVAPVVRHVSVAAMLSSSAREALDELVAREDPSILGLVLSGSAARNMATELSDVDVYVVRDDDVEERPAIAPQSTRCARR